MWSHRAARTPAESLDGVGHGAWRDAVSAVIDEDDVVLRSDVIDGALDPVVEVAAEVLKEPDGSRIFLANRR